MNTVTYLLDTDWVIDHLHRVKAVTARLQELKELGLAVSIISVAELWEGIYYSRDPEQSENALREFLGGVRILEIDAEACKRFGQLRGGLRQQKKLIGDFDLMIGASALTHDLTLLTNNRRHFEQIEGLRIESVLA